MIDKNRITEKAYTMEINMSHPLITKLNEARKNTATRDAAKLVAEQLFDNCLIRYDFGERVAGNGETEKGEMWFCLGKLPHAALARLLKSAPDTWMSRGRW